MVNINFKVCLLKGACFLETSLFLTAWLVSQLFSFYFITRFVPLHSKTSCSYYSQGGIYVIQHSIVVATILLSSMVSCSIMKVIPGSNKELCCLG